MATSTPRFTNRLAKETSPYLLQHAHNPVDWYPWGDEALERARRDDRLILLSIGYSACHWCHVMERESFENEAIAALMNEHFVNIKVDREERPDIDEVYMAATLALNQGQGGWPMTVFLTPALEPVFAGTYFPPRDYYGRPGFATILEAIAKAWQQNRSQLDAQAAGLVAHLRDHHARMEPATAVGEPELRAALQQFSANFDPEWGGFGSAPKFPPATALSLLLRLHLRFNDRHALDIVCTTLDAMARGGIYDHVGGGFARYSTDREWHVPHFEKMLYDNALLTSVYLEAFQVTGNPMYRRIATETLDYVINEMTAENGGFYSSTDADSEGEEGKFFVWTPDEIAAVLDDEAARRFMAYYDITSVGNWEGRSIPRIRRPLDLVAKELGITPRELEASLEAARKQVYVARNERVAPGLDDKILTSWNGLMIRAFADGYRILLDPRYLKAASDAADFLQATHVSGDGQLLRTSRAGTAHVSAYLEDYAYLSEGLISLYEAGGDVRYLREARHLMERALEEFRDTDGGALYHTGHSQERLIVRYREGTDGATPSANAMAASALARLSYHFDRDDFRTAASDVLRAFGQSIAQYPRAFAKSLIVVDFLISGPVELAYVGEGDSALLTALRQQAAKVFVPRRIEGIADPTIPESMRELPLFAGKSLVNGDAALFVCRNFSCRAPITDPTLVAGALAAETLDTGRRAEGGVTSHPRARG